MSEAQTIITKARLPDAMPARRGFWQTLAYHARRNPIGTIGAVVILTVVLVALFAPLIAPFEPTAQKARRLLPPSTTHLLGTDELGRDAFSRIVFGARISLYVGLISVSLALTIGTTIGVLCGYVGGALDNLLMRLVDIMLAFPGLVLAIVIAGLLGPSLTNAMIAIGIIYAPAYARIARSSVLSVQAEPYIEAALLIGGRHLHIIRWHILPNIMAPLIVQTSLMMSIAILSEAALSFLGLGTQPPNPSWGVMLSTGRGFMERAPWLTIFPGLAIMIVVLGFNFLGDGLRDALDPRMRE